MGCKHHIDTGFNNFLQRIQEAAKFFLGIHITISIAKILYTLFAMSGTQVRNTHLLRPVHRINHQCLASRRISSDIPDLVH